MYGCRIHPNLPFLFIHNHNRLALIAWLWVNCLRFPLRTYSRPNLILIRCQFGVVWHYRNHFDQKTSPNSLDFIMFYVFCMDFVSIWKWSDEWELKNKKKHTRTALPALHSTHSSHACFSIGWVRKGENNWTKRMVMGMETRGNKKEEII